tara:strand:+ start:99 stop:578 length:480 start_codon:yes stop_codon:yes gene_type:complete
MNKKIILNKKQIENSIKRLSFEIIERNINNKKICLVGLEENGYSIAKRIEKVISENSKKHLTTIQLKSSKNGFKNSKIIEEDYDVVILIDDVLKSGKTIIYALKFLLEFNIKKLRTLVLIDRGHNDFPVGLDFTGIKLSTTLEEHILVKLGKDESAFLN